MKKIKTKHFLYMMILIIAFGAFVLAYYVGHSKTSNSNTMHFVGKYSTDGVNWTEIHNDNELKNVKTKTIFLKGHFTEEIKKGEPVWIKFHRSIVTISCDDKVVFTNEQAIDRTKMPFINEWSRCDFGGLTSDEEINITINDKSAGLSAGRALGTIYKGDKIDLLRLNLKQHGLQICIAILMICIGIALVLTILALCSTNKKINKSYIFSGLFLVSSGICTIIDYDYITLLVPDIRLINTIDYLSQCCICEFLMVYITSFLENKTLKRISLIISMAMVLGIVGCFFVPIHMHKYLSVQIPTFVICIITAVVFLIYEYFKLKNEKTKQLLMSCAIVSVFIVAEMINFYITDEYWIIVFQFGLTLYACIQFFCLVQQANEMIQESQNAEITKRELMEARVNIMLSQIQPHFLYNALGVIQYLCQDKAPEAEEATVEFSEFLRANIDSLRAEKTISFSAELKHVKNYLSLEKKRFGDRLNVVYDLQTTVFRIPTLTLQPIVENAVRYGIMKKVNGGTVTIATKETDKAIIVTVSDDGMGFDVNQIKEDGRSHIGLDNVKHRLEAMCSGKLEITSKLNIGTVAVITLNKENE